MSIQYLRNTTFAVCILAVGLFAAENPFVGTWKLNAAKSKLAGSGLGQNATVHNESDGKSLKVSVESTDPQGQPLQLYLRSYARWKAWHSNRLSDVRYDFPPARE